MWQLGLPKQGQRDRPPWPWLGIVFFSQEILIAHAYLPRYSLIQRSVPETKQIQRDGVVCHGRLLSQKPYHLITGRLPARTFGRFGDVLTLKRKRLQSQLSWLIYDGQCLKLVWSFAKVSKIPRKTKANCGNQMKRRGSMKWTGYLGPDENASYKRKLSITMTPRH